MNSLLSLLTRFHFKTLPSSAMLRTSSGLTQETQETSSWCLASFKAEVLNLILTNFLSNQQSRYVFIWTGKSRGKFRYNILEGNYELSALDVIVLSL